MDPSYRIRSARAQELPALTEIERRAAVRFAPFGLAELFELMTTPAEVLEEALGAGRLWVAVTGDDAPVGFAAATVVDGLAHLDELDVLPEHGRRGLGTSLVETVCRWARTAGFPAVTLSTLRDVPWNAPFYMRLGFRILDSEDLTPGLKGLIAFEELCGLPMQSRVIMQRDLSSR